MVDPEIPRQPPVFLDPSGRRWGRVRRLAFGVGLLTSLVGIVIIASVLVPPALPAFASRLRASQAAVTGGRSPARRNARRRLFASLQAGARGNVAEPLLRMRRGAAVVRTATPSATTDPEIVGFYVNWDDNSFISFAAHAREMDAVACEWLFVAPRGDSLVAHIDQRVLDVARALPVGQRPRVLAMLSNFSSEDRQFDDGRLERLLRSRTARERSLAAIAELVERKQLGGIVVDFENVPDRLVAPLTSYLRDLHAVLAPMGATVGQAVGADDDVEAIRRYAAIADRTYLMLYDEHYGTSDPGPVASQRWYENRARRLLAVVPREKAILAVGAYGYDWNDADDSHGGTAMTFQDVMAAARDHHAVPRFDRASLNPYLEWTEPDSTDHVVWYLDGVSAYDQVRLASSLGVAGHAIWRLGSEDPSLWHALGRTGLDQPALALSTIPFAGYDVEFKGTGELLRLEATPEAGRRLVTVDSAERYVVSESLATVPTPWVVRRVGDVPHKVALTFDDGPDWRWTPAILDTLRARHVPATFFVIGKNVQSNIRLTQRIYAEGHEIGNHTWSHPNLALEEPWLMRLELGATERIIEAVLDRRTALFRPPYFGDAEPTTQDALGPISVADALGFVTAGVHVDSDDWREDDPRSIVHNVLTQRARGNVVLLHDGGGVRRATVAALGPMIDSLRARGDTLVLLSQLAGIPRSAAMPPLPPSSATARFLELASFAAVGAVQDVVYFVFALAIVLGLGRLAVLTVLALVQRSRSAHVVPDESYRPHVSVIVPAYNESRVIRRTIDSLLSQDYAGTIDVVVVDDGSPDYTYAEACRWFADHPRVSILTKPNGGKSSALNLGITRARGEIVVCLDADTIFQRDTVRRLVAPLADPAVGAVAGNAKVGNRLNIVTRWQALEYVTSQNLDRRAFAMLNAITVVPGAVGAWRRECVVAAGGFSHDTLAEDQDLTIAIRRSGKRIAYAHDAIAWTEAPDTLAGLARQRFRWSFGTLQCAWKYRRSLLAPRSGSLGWVALPNTWVFQLLLTALSPLADLAFVWSLASVWMMRIQHGATYADQSLERLVTLYALFLLVDWAVALLAFFLEPGEDKRMTWLVFLQRCVYRQLMYWVVLRAFASAIRGRVVGWGKLERKATVPVGVGIA